MLPDSPPVASPSLNISAMPPSDSPMKATVRNATRSRRNSQASSAANTGAMPTVKATLATVVLVSAKMKVMKELPRVSEQSKPVRPIDRNLSPILAPWRQLKIDHQRYDTEDRAPEQDLPAVRILGKADQQPGQAGAERGGQHRRHAEAGPLRERGRQETLVRLPAPVPLSDVGEDMGFRRAAGMGDGALLGRADGLGVAPQGAGLEIMLARLPALGAFRQFRVASDRH